MDFQFDLFAANVNCSEIEDVVFTPSTLPRLKSAYVEAPFTCPGIDIAHSLALYNSQAEKWNYRV